MAAGFHRRARFPAASLRAMLWAISGGAGFLGLHLARRLLAGGHAVPSLDVAPLDEPELERAGGEGGGDIRDPAGARRPPRGADVLLPAAAAPAVRGPGRGSRP